MDDDDIFLELQHMFVVILFTYDILVENSLPIRSRCRCILDYFLMYFIYFFLNLPADVKHVLLRIRSPWPHECEQSVHSAQSVHVGQNDSKQIFSSALFP